MNLVIPEALAVIRSAPLMLLTASEAFEPIELLTNSGNSVVAPAAPMRTWESKSPESIRLPLP